MKKVIIAAGVTVAAAVGTVAPASADHIHSMEVSDGVCVLLAAAGGTVRGTPVRRRLCRGPSAPAACPRASRPAR